MVNIFFFKAALGIYFLGMVSFLYFLVNRNAKPPRLSFALTGLGFLIHTVALIVRTAEATYIPITNLHEAMAFFSWALVLAFLLIEYKYRIYVLGSFVLPVTFISLISSATLPMEIKMLDPQLQSVWLGVHTILAIMGSAAFSVAFLAGVMYLLQEWFLKSKRFNNLYFKLPALDMLDNLNYRAISFGFPLLTLGIITGSIWAEYAWGTYWNWDPKQTWSLIVWLFYAAMLHGRITVGWRGRKAAYLAIIGFAGVIFTFAGVNLLLQGRHAFL